MTNEPIDNEHPEQGDGEYHGLKDTISGLGQKIIGEIETIGGILTADPNTAAEGEFNLEIGELREETEEDLESSKPPHREDSETE